MRFDVIYGDTDSIMLNMKTVSIEEAVEQGIKVKNKVNSVFKKLELNVDNIFKNLILYKKKKYAALNSIKLPDGTYKFKKELKGIDIVRRDWPNVVKCLGNKIVDLILENCEDFSGKILEEIAQCARKIRDQEFNIQDYEIYRVIWISFCLF